jgi:hypothetical protein
VEDEGSSEDDKSLEMVVPGDPVEGSDKVLSTNNGGGALVQPARHGFDKSPGYVEARLRTQSRMDKGGPFRRHPRPPVTPVPPRRKSTASQPVQRVTPLQLVSTSSSQPEVYSHMVGALEGVEPDLLYRVLLLVQAPLVSNGNCAPEPRSNPV